MPVGEGGDAGELPEYEVYLELGVEYSWVATGCTSRRCGDGGAGDAEDPYMLSCSIRKY